MIFIQPKDRNSTKDRISISHDHQNINKIVQMFNNDNSSMNNQPYIMMNDLSHDNILNSQIKHRNRLATAILIVVSLNLVLNCIFVYYPIIRYGPMAITIIDSLKITIDNVSNFVNIATPTVLKVSEIICVYLPSYC